MEMSLKSMENKKKFNEYFNINLFYKIHTIYMSLRKVFKRMQIIL